MSINNYQLLKSDCICTNDRGPCCGFQTQQII